ncbi:MAG: hypothetical protein WDN46_20415 [Methylocella sp.]
MSAAASAQTDATAPANPGADGLNQNNLTSTGAAAPHPGVVSEDPSPATLTGRSIRDNNDHGVEKSICANCSQP